jgi:hypothetical protein
METKGSEFAVSIDPGWTGEGFCARAVSRTGEYLDGALYGSTAQEALERAHEFARFAVSGALMLRRADVFSSIERASA